MTHRTPENRGRGTAPGQSSPLLGAVGLLVVEAGAARVGAGRVAVYSGTKAFERISPRRSGGSGRTPGSP
jgi:hypothetical protein